MKNVLLVSTDTPVINLLTSNASALNFELDVLEPSDNLLSTIASVSPDVLMIDFILSNSNGGGLCHQVKCDARLNYLPVILLSDVPGLENVSAKFGCNAVINKPLDMEVLNDVLRKLSAGNNLAKAG